MQSPAVADLLGISGNRPPQEPYEAQIFQAFKERLDDILLVEGQFRDFFPREMKQLHHQLAASGNPISFAHLVAMRHSADEAIPFASRPGAPCYERVMVGTFDEKERQFKGQAWLPGNDSRLGSTYRDQDGLRDWLFRIPLDYPFSIILGSYQGEQLPYRYTVLYKPAATQEPLQSRLDSPEEGHALAIAVRGDFLGTVLERFLLDLDIATRPLELTHTSRLYELTFPRAHLERLDLHDERGKLMLLSPEQRDLIEQRGALCTVYVLHVSQHIIFYVQAADWRESFLAPANLPHQEQAIEPQKG